MSRVFRLCWRLTWLCLPAHLWLHSLRHAFIRPSSLPSSHPSTCLTLYIVMVTCLLAHPTYVPVGDPVPQPPSNSTSFCPPLCSRGLFMPEGPPTQASWHSISSRGQRGLGYPSQGACSPGDLCGSSCHCFSVPCQEPGVVRGQDTPLGIWFPRASLVATVLLGHLVLIVRICARSAAPEGPGLVRPSSGGVAIVSG